MEKNILITICARGGSKGVPGKNVRLLNGKTLITYTLEQARNWNRPKDIVISTDSEQIAEVVRGLGFEVPFLRPDELAQDDTPKIPVIRHALAQAEIIYRKKYDLIVDLDVTAPLREPEDLENCYQKFCRMKPLTLFSVVEAHRNPYFNMVEVSGDGYARLCKSLPSGVHTRQGAPKVFDMNASIYFYDRNYLMDETMTSPVSSKSTVYEMSPESAYDVDREIDFRFLEFLMRERQVRV